MSEIVFPADHGFASHFFQVGPHRMHYLDEGQGPVVLLLHGNPTWCYYFRSLVSRLRARFRVIVPDYIGCGLSDHPVDAHFRARDRVNHLHELLNHLRVEQFSLVMHDWGGPIGTWLGLERLPNLQRIVYLNTTLTEIESLPNFIRLAANPISGPLVTKHTATFLRWMTDFGVARALPKATKELYLAPYRTAARRTAIWDFVNDIPFRRDHPTYADLLRIEEGLVRLRSIPMQIIWGLRDPCFHKEILSQIVRHFPEAEVLEIADASHLVLEDAPELAGSTIETFLLPLTNSAHTPVQPAVTKPSSAHCMYESFLRVAAEQPTAAAVTNVRVQGGAFLLSRVTYEALRERVYRYERGLSHLGLQAGDRVVLFVPPGEDFLALSYAIMGRGAVPVFIDPGIGLEHVLHCLQETQPQGFIGVPKSLALRALGRRSFGALRFTVTAIDVSLPRVATLALLKRFAPKPLPVASCTNTALIAFTSGGTGIPKGVVFTQANLQAQLSILRASFGLTSGQDLPLLPIFSLFGVALGAGAVFPPFDFSRPLSLDPEIAVRVIQELQVTSSFGSPTLWRKIADYATRKQLQLPSLRTVNMAGAPVSAETLQRVQALLPNGEACTPYGATEALPVTRVSAADLQGIPTALAVSGEEGTCVGTPVPGVEVRVVRRSSEAIADIAQALPLPPLEIGEVLVRGPNVSPEYYGRPEADRRAKIQDGSTFWHRMGDVGYLDAAGHIFFCGRAVHVVETPSRTLYPIPIERIFNAHPDVARSALVQYQKEDAAIVIEPRAHRIPRSEEEQSRFARELRDLAARSSVAASIQHIFFCEAFPVDGRHNAKIFRDKLARWVAAHEEKVRPSSTATPEAARALMQRLIPNRG